MTPVLLVVWLCAASTPHCAIKDDPTGPPVVLKMSSVEQCEDIFKMTAAIIPNDPRYVTRHSCLQTGEGI